MTDIDIGYGLDTTDYVAGINAIEAANARLQGSFTQTATMAGGVGKALSLITPGKAVLGSMALLSVQAAQNQQALSGLAATATVTNVRVDTLAKGIRTMARDMPLGGQASRQLVEQFTRMGVAGEGSEKKIVRLSTAVAKLSGATGENASGLATGMTELARATGNTNLDPKRFEAIGDSLTTVAAKSGASATSILQFSKNIAPMAQASGIGATGILGISSAFARLGEDGIGAQTAVNKMLSDMNRSVREGSPELKTYAQFAGQTAEEFERLFKSNPAEALTQVTEAIAKAGPAGPRMLEQIGVEGIRGQRSIQALVASGGTRQSIADATAAYGSGSTNKAAEAAFGGLNDSLTQLGEATEQVAEAFGQPLLKPLTTFTDALTQATGGIAKLAGSDVAQKVMQVGVYAGLVGLALKTISGPLGALILARQAATSGPGRFAMAGRNAANEAAGIPVGRRAELYGRNAQAAAQSGEAGRINMAAFNASKAAQEERIASGKVSAASGPSFFARAGQTLGGYGSGIVSTYSNMVGQQARNARVDFPQRQSSWGVAPTFRTAWDAGRGAASADPTMSKLAALGKGLNAFDQSVRDTSKGLGGLRGATVATGSALFQTARAAGALGKDMGKGAMAGARGIGLGGFGPMIAITAATTAIASGKGNLNEQKQAREDFMQSDIAKTINAYRESIGKATDATQTYTSVSEQMNKNLAAGAKLGSFSAVKQISDDDWAAAQSTSGKKVSTYTGSVKEIAAQIQAMAPNGVAPEDLQAVKVDLGRQMDRDKAQAVLNALPASFEASADLDSGMGRDEMAKIIRTVAGGAVSEASGPTGWAKWQNEAVSNGMGSENLGKLDTAANTPEWMRIISMAPGGGLHSSTLTDASRAQIGAINEGNAQQYTSNITKFGGKYAEQERGKNVNAALKEAYDAGNADVFLELSQKAGAQMDASLKDKIWSPEEFKEAGYDFTKMVAKASDSYRSTRKQAEDDGAKFTGTGGLKADLIEQSYTKDIRRRSALLGDVFDARSKSAGAVAMSASLAAPADAGKRVDALNAVVMAADKAGKSMTDLAVEAAKSAQAVGESTDAYARLKAIQSRAEFEMSSRGTMSGASSSQMQVERLGYLTKIAAIKPTNDAEAQQQQDAKQGILSEMDSSKARMQARLQMQRQAEVTEQRARQDQRRSEQYAEADYERQRFRTLRNFRISSGRAEDDFRRSQKRAEEDFGISRVRQVRDFGIQMTRATQDYLKSRERAFRDFNISLKRQIEDAAKSMYDPYSRIQTKATWDTKNLLVNLNEQTAAIEKQKSQLDDLRKMGLSAQAIDILGLGKAENAQQLNNVMADATPESIAAMNAAAKARAEAAGTMYTDASNIDLTRQREDFNKSMKDAEEDFKKSVKRQREDLNRSMRDAGIDFNRAQGRARADFKRSLERSRMDLNTNLADMATDRDTAMARSKKALDVQLKRMTEDIRMADQTINADMATLAEQVDKAIHGRAVSWQKVLKSDTASWVKDMKSNVIPQVNAVFSSMGVTAADVANPGNSSLPGSEHTRRAEGGPIPGYSPHPKADNVLIKATAGEFMQPVAAVNYYGPAVMEKMRRRQIPRDQLQGLAEGGMVYKQMAAWVGKNLPGVAITSSYRPGAITALGNVSMHAQGKALDLAPSMATFNKILGSFGKNIHQLFYSPADGRTMLRGRPWRMDSTTKSGHWDHVHWAMESMQGLAAALGADPEAIKAIFAKAPRKGNLQKALSNKTMAAVIAALSSASGANGAMPPFKGPEDVSRWGDEVATVLRMLGRPMSDAGSVLRRIQFESGGNPRAINNWDSNARRGTPSKGLMQVIDPTFKAYHSRSLPNDIWNPKSNIYAGSNYAVKRYGSLAAIDPKTRPKGYDDGGWMQPGRGEHVNGTGKPEAVLTNKQWRDISKIAGMVSLDQLRGVNAAAGAHIVVNNNQNYAYDYRNDFSDAAITVVSADPDEMARKIEAKVVSARLTQTRGVRRNR